MRQWLGAILMGIALVSLAAVGLFGGSDEAGASPVPPAPIVYKVTVNPAPVAVVKAAPKLIVNVGPATPAPKAPAATPEPQVETCAAFASQIEAVGNVNPDEITFAMHAIGCDFQNGRYEHREGRYGAGCNALAYHLASRALARGESLVDPEAGTIHTISVKVRATGCNHYEDGTYGKWAS